uniref:TFIIS N-terminal domain-containing protein n=1 Tax=Leersia perrieri TaxID=77586 RepID=A0A0D9XI81_9ORYZ
MATGGEAIPEAWKKLVRSLGSEQLVDAIYVAIDDLAARDTIPHEVLRRMAAVREQLPSVGEVEVATINTKLVATAGSSEATVVELLRALRALPMTFETLEKTKIGKTITSLTKHSSEQVRGLAGELYKKWRPLVSEHLRSSSKPTTKTSSAPLAVAAREPAASTTTAAIKTVSNKSTDSALAAAARRAVQATVAMKKTATNNKRKEAPEMEEARLEAATKKLREGYREAETAKKERKIQIINAPPRKVKPRFVVVERRAPVAASLRM